MPRLAAICALHLALLASGAAGLVFELLWFRLAGLSFGNTVWASSVVLAAFMGGLALGNALAASRHLAFRRPLLWYAAAEGLIAISGLALLWVLPRVAGWLPAGMQLDHGLRWLLAFALMLPPATAMGLTLPLVLRALYADGRYGDLVGRLYGINTLGAVGGVLAAEYLLLMRCGVIGSGLLAAGLNLLAALLALGLARNWPASSEIRSRQAWSWMTGHRWLLAGFISGALLLALEVVWFRLLLLHVRGTATSFAVMLAMVLTGIALGGFVTAGYLHRRSFRVDQAVLVILLAALGVALGYRGLPAEAGLSPWLGSTALMLATAIASGSLFTLLCTGLAQQLTEPSRATGRLLIANTAGGMVGAGIAGLWLLPQFGIQISLAVLMLGYLACALLLIPASRPRWLLWPALALASLGLFPWQGMQSHLQAARQPWQALDDSRLVFEREGLNETVQLLQRELFTEPLAHRVVTNGESMSGTERDSRRYMKLFAWLPMALHPGIEDTLLISYGLGSTAEALLADPGIRHIDVVDISPAILQASRLTHANSPDPLDDPRVTVHIEDGRHFLLTRQQQYDLISGEPPPPRLAGIVNLYTREYFSLMQTRLKPGGMASYWLPVDQLTLASSRAILRAFCDVFADCSLWAGSNYNWILLGSRDARAGNDAAQIQRLWQIPGLRSQLGALGLEEPAQLGASFLADAAQISQWVDDAEPLSDNWPKRLSENAPTQKTLQRYADWLDSDNAARRFSESAWLQSIWPASLQTKSLDYYVLQPILNNEIRAPLEVRLRMVDGISGQTRLRIPVFWLLDSGIREQGIVDRRLKATGYRPEYAWHLGVRALAERRYDVAADLFGDYLSIDRDRALPAAIYALCRSGQSAKARQLAETRPDLAPGLHCW